MPIDRHAWLALLAPLPATAVGAAVASQHGIAISAFVPNVIAVVLGAIGAIARISSKPEGGRWAARWLPLVSFFVIAATLATPGLEGIHRWLSLGPLRSNASTALLPWLFLGMISPEPRARTRAVGLACGVQLVHFAQPDAAQATVLTAGALPLLCGDAVGEALTSLTPAAAAPPSSPTPPTPHPPPRSPPLLSRTWSRSSSARAPHPAPARPRASPDRTAR